MVGNAVGAMVVAESCSSRGADVSDMAAQGTTNYVYFVDQQLGLGATGNVYLGRHKVGLTTLCTSCVCTLLFLLIYLFIHTSCSSL